MNIMVEKRKNIKKVFKTIQNVEMSENQESIIREQVILLLLRNIGKEQRIMKRFLKCINGGYNEAKKIINET